MKKDKWTPANIIWLRYSFPLKHPRKWLCDKGWLCVEHHVQFERDGEILSEVADLIQDIKGHNAFPNYVAKPITDLINRIERTINDDGLDPDCPNCQCGGNLCDEHGVGIVNI